MSDVREASLEPGAQRLPGGALGQVGPFLLLAAGAVWLYASWDRLPSRLPVHWNYRFEPDSFVSRTPSGAALPLLLGLAICAMMVAMQLGVIHRAPRTAMRAPTLRIVLAGEYFVACACFGVLAASITAGRLLIPVLALIFAGVLALLAGTMTLVRKLPRAEVRNPAAWRGLFYVDRNDPALFVPKRAGVGYTFNYGNPWAVVVTVALLGIPLLAAFLAITAR